MLRTKKFHYETGTPHFFYDDNILLLSASAKVLSQKVRYRMYLTQPPDKNIYRFLCVYGKDKYSCSVICSRQTADSIFFALVRGRITPCSAHYIMEELTNESDSNIVE